MTLLFHCGNQCDPDRCLDIDCNNNRGHKLSVAIKLKHDSGITIYIQTICHTHIRRRVFMPSCDITTLRMVTPWRIFLLHQSDISKIKCIFFYTRFVIIYVATAATVLLVAASNVLVTVVLVIIILAAAVVAKLHHISFHTLKYWAVEWAFRCTYLPPHPPFPFPPPPFSPTFRPFSLFPYNLSAVTFSLPLI